MVTTLMNQISPFPPGITLPTASGPAAGAPTKPATPAPTTALPGAPQGNSSQMITQVVGIITLLLVSMIQEMMGGGSAASLAAPTPGPIAGPASSPAVLPPVPAGAAPPGGPVTKGSAFNGNLRIAQIDNFSDAHGNEIANTLKKGGADAGLGGKVDLLQFDINNGGPNKVANINAALSDIISRVQRGEKIDAVNISLQGDGADTKQTSALVDQLISMGVPVAVAAGNNGPNVHNGLEGGNSFNVQSATNGQLNGTSGRGNITANGQTTSFATANLTPLLAMLRAQGLSIAQIRATLGQMSF